MIIVSDMGWNYQSAPNPGVPVFWLGTNGEYVGHYGEPPFGTLVPLRKSTDL